MSARDRIVVVGDLNGARDVLDDILRRTRLVDGASGWIGGRAQLVQIGDIFNRGGGARSAFEWLLSLRRQATRVGGRVTLLLGNHEAMTALGHEAYCTAEEYLSFASIAQREAWPARVDRATMRIIKEHPPGGPIPPFEPRLEAWKIAKVPGRAEMRRQIGPAGRLGRALRALPIAYAAKGNLFCHSTIRPEWAALGIDGLNQRARWEWRNAPRFWGKVSRDSLLRAPEGPLWDRSWVRGGRRAARELTQSLERLDATRMIVGHTQTGALNGGKRGRIHQLFGGRLVLVDVGLESGADSARAALIIQGQRGWEWTPGGRRLLWQD
jgi:hypothetical protein